MGRTVWKTVRMFMTKVLTIGPAAIVIFDNTVYAAKVEGDSMQPILNPPDSTSNDFVLLNRWRAKRFNFSRGDIVVLTSPRDPKHMLIKRIIALEGDTVKKRSDAPSDISPITVIPAGHCWVEGDHSSRSLDSNVFGPIPIGLIIATATHVVWPVNRWQKLDNKTYDRSRVLPYMTSIIEDDA